MEGVEPEREWGGEGCLVSGVEGLVRWRNNLGVICLVRRIMIAYRERIFSDAFALVVGFFLLGV